MKSHVLSNRQQKTPAMYELINSTLIHVHLNNFSSYRVDLAHCNHATDYSRDKPSQFALSHHAQKLAALHALWLQIPWQSLVFLSHHVTARFGAEISSYFTPARQLF